MHQQDLEQCQLKRDLQREIGREREVDDRGEDQGERERAGGGRERDGDQSALRRDFSVIADGSGRRPHTGAPHRVKDPARSLSTAPPRRQPQNATQHIAMHTHTTR
jgi:hypothetical protein